LAAVQYDNGSSETFLRWLWHEPYGDEPFDADSFSGLQGLEQRQSAAVVAWLNALRSWLCRGVG